MHHQTSQRSPPLLGPQGPWSAHQDHWSQRPPMRSQEQVKVATKTNDRQHVEMLLKILKKRKQQKNLN